MRKRRMLSDATGGYQNKKKYIYKIKKQNDVLKDERGPEILVIPVG